MRQRGFSLIELMVALAIFAIAVSGMMALLATTVKANAGSIDGTHATGLADGWLESLRMRQAGWIDGVPVASAAPELAVLPGKWTLPIAASSDAWADGQPHDADGRRSGQANARKAIFCVHYRTTWLPLGAALGATEEVMVTVRAAYPADGGESWTDCDPSTVDASLADQTARAVIINGIVRRR